MSRYPCHVEAALRVKVRRGHQGIWEAIRDRRGEWWTILRVWQDTGVPDRGTVRDYVSRLYRAGYLEREKGDVVAVFAYRLIRDAGPEAPRLRRDGREVPPTGQEAMWRTIRMIGGGGLTADDLVVMASTELRPVSRIAAACYLGHLHRAGYLREVEPGTGKLARYALRTGMNTGPQAPMIARISHAVWDPNKGEFMGPVEADVSGGGHG